MIITRTPLRLSFFGGGTDLHSFYYQEEGMVLSTTINKYIYVIVKEQQHDSIHLKYWKNEVVSTVDEIEHEIIRETMKLTGVSSGVEIIITSDVSSQGTGLGSSSSLTVGLLNAFYHFQGKKVSAETLAKQACYVEMILLNKTMGKQDQYSAAYGGMNVIRFLPNDEVVVKQNLFNTKDIEYLRQHLLLFYTGITRKNEQILSDQSNKVKVTRSKLQEMRDQVEIAVAKIRQRDMTAIGDLLKRGWELKRSLSNKISNPEIDDMVYQAYEAGALGCKIAGAGGGGFLLVVCHPNHHSTMRRALSNYQEHQFDFTTRGSHVIFDNKLQLERDDSFVS